MTQRPDVRRRVDDPRAEALAGRGRRPGHRRRQLAARGARRAQSDRAQQVRHRPRGRARGDRRRQRQPPEGRRSRTASGTGRSTPTTRRRRPPSTCRSSSPIATAPRCAWPTSPRSSTRCRTCATPASANGKPSVLLIINRQPNANIIETVDRVHGAAAAAARVDPERDRPRRWRWTARRRSARRCARSSARWSIAVGAGDPGRVPVPAQRARDADPERRGAGVADRHVRRHVPVRLQPQQPLADGAHDRHRLRRRRRDRRAREHLAPHREGHDAAARRRCRARARSASPCCR